MQNPRTITITINKVGKPGGFAMLSRAHSFTNSSPFAIRSRKQPRHFLKILLALAFTVVATFPAAATDKTDVVATVRKFVESFNKGDMKALTATCADQASIIDEFPPYEWHGSGACAKWTDDYGADAKKNGITDGVVTLGAPLHVDVTAERAYVVVPANYKFKHNGKAVQETGSTLTIALQKSGDAWRMTGWAWAKH
jgi:ketosteroid isomerase-like protein